MWCKERETEKGVVTEEMMVSWSLEYLYHNGFCEQTSVVWVQVWCKTYRKEGKLKVRSFHSSVLLSFLSNRNNERKLILFELLYLCTWIEEVLGTAIFTWLNLIFYFNIFILLAINEYGNTCLFIISCPLRCQAHTVVLPLISFHPIINCALLWSTTPWTWLPTPPLHHPIPCLVRFPRWKEDRTAIRRGLRDCPGQVIGVESQWWAWHIYLILQV